MSRHLRIRLITLTTLLMVMLLASCSDPSSPLRSEEPLSSSSFSKDRNCPITSFDAPGQGLRAAGTGLRAAGTVGGFIISDLNKPPIANTSPKEVATSYLSSFSHYPATEKVGIIVLDQFRYDGVDAFTLRPSILDLIDAAQSGPKDLKEVFWTLRASGDISHGALVLSHINAILSASPDTYLVSASPDLYEFQRGQATIYVKAVDMQDMNTDNMVPALEGAFEDLGNYGVERFAVNMSFSLVPCKLLKDAERAGYDHLDNYLSVLAFASGKSQDELIGDFGDQVDPSSDPFITYLAKMTHEGAENTVLVSAAGNFQRDYPMYPALAENVVSVSSFDFNAAKFSAFSNFGEVMAPGWLFHIADPISLLATKNISYAGTSFAAPAATAYAAFDLAQPSPRCFDYRTNALLNPSMYKNTPLKDAVYSCP